MNRLRTTILAGGLLAFAACDNDATDATQTQAEAVEPAVPQHVGGYIDDVEALVFAQTGRTEGDEQSTSLIMEALGSDRLRDLLSDEAADALSEMYRQRDQRPLLTTTDSLTPAAIAVIEELNGARWHGITDEELNLAAIRESVHQVAALSRQRPEPVADTAPQSFDDTQRDELTSWLQARSDDFTALPAPESVAHLIVARAAEAPFVLPGVDMAEDDDAFAPGELALAELDVLLTDAIRRWAAIMNFNNENNLIRLSRAYSEDMEAGHPFDASVAVPADFELLEGEDRAAAYDAWRAAGLAHTLHRISSGEDAVLIMRELQPQFVEYERLVDGARRYEAILASGGWETIDSSAELLPGRSYREIPELRRRLAAEGYWDGPLEGERYDDALRDAVIAYQETHQLIADGDIGEFTWSSLNVTPERRIAQIHATLDRWRSSRMAQTAGGEYIVVNIPDFHGELWDRGERIHRWATVVGKLKRRREDNGEMRYWGATPLFSDEMEYIVYNPYWNVPGNIWRDEYADEIEEDPEWLEENNFEILVNDVGNEFLRQRPGVNNALGVVKFLFPNDEHIYLHDTNQKQLFGSNLRAYSHGCIRTEDPLELAAILTARDLDITIEEARDNVHGHIQREEEQWTSLNRHIPIHLEYFATRGDERGRVHFLADIYRYDRADVDGRQQVIEEQHAEFERERDELRERAEELWLQRSEESAHAGRSVRLLRPGNTPDNNHRVLVADN